MTKKLLSLILILVFSTSCARFVGFFEPEQEFTTLEYSKPPLFCKQSTKLNIISENELDIEDFKKVSTKLINKYQYNFIELSMAYIVYQSIIRFDASNKHSRAQYLFHYKGKQHYIDLNKANNLSFKDSLSYLSNYYRVRSPAKIIAHLERILPLKITARDKLSLFLTNNKKNMFQYGFANDFYKVSQAIKPGETYPITKKFYSTFNTSKINSKKVVAPPVFPVRLVKDSEYKLNCNFDSGLYQNGILLIHRKSRNINTFALTDDNNNSFMAYTSDSSDLPFSKFKKIEQAPVPFCFYQDSDKSISMMAFNSMDPGQILYHLINYDVFSSKSIEDLVHYINFPRHEILNTPARLHFESKRSSQKQLDYFLSLSLPVYHIEKIGELWTIYSSKEQTTFITDDRNPAKQSCQEQM